MICFKYSLFLIRDRVTILLSPDLIISKLCNLNYVTFYCCVFLLFCVLLFYCLLSGGEFDFDASMPFLLLCIIAFKSVILEKEIFELFVIYILLKSRSNCKVGKKIQFNAWKRTKINL